jgi:5-methyltetrahydropteroyltriglutamate--homocysteine methyltransferase
MIIPTESIGSIPRKRELIEAIGQGLATAQLDALYQASLQETITLLAQTGATVLTDGEQTKSSFVTYPLEGSTILSPKGAVKQLWQIDTSDRSAINTK